MSQIVQKRSEMPDLKIRICQAFLSFLWRPSCGSQSAGMTEAYGQTLDTLPCRLRDDVGPLG